MKAEYFKSELEKIEKSDQQLKEEMGKIANKQRENRKRESDLHKSFAQAHSPYKLGEKIVVEKREYGKPEDVVVAVDRIFCIIRKNGEFDFRYRCKKVKKNGEISEHYFRNRDTIYVEEVKRKAE